MKLTLSLAIVCIAICHAQTRPSGPATETGEINGAKFRIDIPANWNGGLVVYAHGYTPPESQFLLVGEPDARPTGGAQVMAAVMGQGYAIAQSAFSAQGLALREGALDSEALRQHFVRKYGKTYPTIFSGLHGGGIITFGAIEKFPEQYDGAIAIGGIPEPSLEFIKRRMFDMRLLFDYYLPGLPGSVVEFPDNVTWASIRADAKKIVDANPEKAKDLLRMYNLKNTDELWRCMGLYTSILKDLNRNRAHGNAFDNRNTIYRGSSDDAKLNREIKRYKSDPKAVEYVKNWTTPACKITSPVLAVNSLIDPVVPSQDTHYYGEMCNREGKSDLFVQMWMDMQDENPLPGPEGLTWLFRTMDQWIRNGKRPVGGEMTQGVKKK